MEKEKRYMDWRDIRERYHVCKGRAYGIINAIRLYCNETLLPTGKVTPEEVEYWERTHHLKEMQEEPQKKEPTKKAEPVKKPEPQPTQPVSRYHDVFPNSVCIAQPWKGRRTQ